MPASSARQFLSRHRVAVSTLSILLIALIVFIVLFDWNWFRGPLARFATDKTGRQVQIGHLDVRWDNPSDRWLMPTVVLDQLQLGNVDWSKTPDMVKAKRVAVTLSLRELWHKRVVIPFINIDEPDVMLERRADGHNNWVLSRSGDPASAAPDIHHLSIRQGRIRYEDALLDAKVVILADTLQTEPTQTVAGISPYGTKFTFTGAYKKADFNGTAQTGNVLSLQNGASPFAVQTRIQLAKTVVSAQGTITNLLKPTAVDLRLTIKGQSLAQLYPFLLLPLPETPPYQATGQLTVAGDQYAYRHFNGTIGKTDIAGDAQYVMRSPRPKLSATLSSRVLDLNDLGPLIGLKPTSAPEGSATASTAVATSASSASAASLRKPDNSTSGVAGRVLPQRPFELDKLNLLDADVTLKAQQLRGPSALALEDFYAALKLEAGVLQLKPLKFGYAGGQVQANLNLNATAQPMNTTMNAELQHIQLKKAFPTVKLMRESTGQIGGKMQLAGRGNSVAAMLANADGAVALGMAGGSISNLIVELAGLDGGEILKFWLEGDRNTAIRCGIAAFDIKKGQGTSRSLMFDTVDTRIDGSGQFDLANERFDITLRPKPKDMSILVLRTPLRAHGSFSKPEFGLEKSGLLARGGGALLLGLINPLAALIPLIETGGGKDGQCAGVLEASTGKSH